MQQHPAIHFVFYGIKHGRNGGDDCTNSAWHCPLLHFPVSNQFLYMTSFNTRKSAHLVIQVAVFKH